MRVLYDTIAHNKQKRNSRFRQRQASLTSFFTRLRAASPVGFSRQQRLGLQNRSETCEAGLAAKGFTIVELLIVVVVIAILAAIVIVSYNGITSQAKEAALKADLSNGAKQLGIARVETGSYPSNANDLKKSSGTTFSYTSPDDNTFCLSAISDSLAGKSFKITEAGSIEEGSCGVSGSSIANTMQTFTSAMCASLDTYNGTNEDAIITLKDTRADQQEYQVAKLADDNCWMLNNLRLGSTIAAITLTPSDSDVASNFTLPQVTYPDDMDYDNPQTFGPVDGDTGSGATNYGYLYNFSAATAGESRATLPANGGDAQHSICAKGWNLPSGGLNAGEGDFSRLDQAFGGTGAYPGAPIHIATNWLDEGVFKGVFSGGWYGGFSGQGWDGMLWSRSAYLGSVETAFYGDFTAGDIDPGGYGERDIGRAVRCLLS